MTSRQKLILHSWLLAAVWLTGIGAAIFTGREKPVKTVELTDVEVTHHLICQGWEPSGPRLDFAMEMQRGAVDVPKRGCLSLDGERYEYVRDARGLTIELDRPITLRQARQ